MRPLACLLLLLLALPGRVAAQPSALCQAAIAQAERESGIPPRLLAAIGRVESGRRDPATGGTAPWPWTINAEGRGSFFPDRAAAIAAVRALQAQGVRSIDVGCMQINLRHHPNAFASLEEAFEPLANARYAARFLTELQSTRGDWMRAAAHYHSQTPEYAEPYRARVAAAWEAERGAPAAMGYAAALRAHGSFGGPGAARLENPAPMAVASGSGRGLDAYRARPIPLVGGARPVLAMAATTAPAAPPGLPALTAPGLTLPAPAAGRAVVPAPAAGRAVGPAPAAGRAVGPAPAAGRAVGPAPARGGGFFAAPRPAGALIPLAPRS